MTRSRSPSPDPLPLSREVRVDRICDEFERQWKAGQQPRIEDYLAPADSEDRDHLLRELLVLEWEFRGDAGQQPGLEEYRQRFPQQAAVVEAAWAALGRRPAILSEGSTEDFVQRQDTPSGEAPTPLPPDEPEQMPERIGRYQIREKLGRGGFAVVYLAHDPDLGRRVALKVPRRDRFRDAVDLDGFIDEARNTVQLEHPRIVRIHDVQRMPGSAYVVQQYIDGQDLAKYAKSTPLRVEQIVELMLDVAAAVGFAHQQGFVHRDLKPGNILLNRQEEPFVADFGLALHIGEQHRHRGELAGSYPYMSPEQVRGESHRLDGRSDIWSLGVILYELLTGVRPFSGTDRTTLFEEIEHRDPRPIREINPSVSRELARICLTCLAKRKTDRYETTADLIDDLRHWRDGKPSPTATQNSATTAAESRADTPDSTLSPPPVKVVPKGLRSFDAGDADFFLELLPGPYDRQGLPNSIRFWKTKIEERDPDETFAVGLMYGPSGCGKSSRVKAALLPRLSPDVLPLYVEATATDTEVRLLKTLRKRCPELPGDASLPELLTHLRNHCGSRGRKVLVVLDQFEQWLHACTDYGGSQLVRALRQCDGAGVQCLVLVRADFWMSITRFMQALEIPLVEGSNSAAVDLFDPDHAQKVLAAFGRAYGRLADSPEEIAPDQRRFLDLAVQGLAQEGKVVCVRLAVLAEMLKGRPWTDASLEDVGGAEGVGVTFLDESFTAQTAPPSHRRHEKAARAVLRELLPEQGTDIKGQMKSYNLLLQASRYASRRGDFAALLGILDNELRLITPTEPDTTAEGDDEEAAPATDAKHYQLTHDYLAPSLRDWLTRKQKETRRGRAELRLAERAALWNAKPENRYLPSVWEYLSISCLTQKKTWTEPQARVMRRAGRVIGWRWGSGLVVALLALVLVQQIVSSILAESLSERIDTAVSAMSTSRGIDVRRAIENLEVLPRGMVIAELKRRFGAGPEDRNLSLAYALAHFGDVRVDFLISQIKTASRDEVDNLVTALGYEQEAAVAALTATAARCQSDLAYKGRLAVVALHLSETAIASEMLQLRADPVQRTFLIHHTLPTWHGDLSRLAAVLDASIDAPLRSGVCLGIGQIAVDDLRVEVQEASRPVLLKWYEEDADCGTHSAAGWTLRQWQVPLPEIPASTEPVNGREWYVNRTGMTMLRIPEGSFFRRHQSDAKPQEVTLTPAFFLSDREVWLGMFQRFVDDANYEHEKPKPTEWPGVRALYDNETPDHPVWNVSWYNAVKFCNWLSRREGRKPCYEFKGVATGGPGARSEEIWELIPAADGYRLPSEAEWEYACRAGTETAFTFGDDESLLGKYAVFRAESPQAIGSRLPNAWGLFDMHGNVSEWCQDWYGEGAHAKRWENCRFLSKIGEGGLYSPANKPDRKFRQCRSSLHLPCISRRCRA